MCSYLVRAEGTESFGNDMLNESEIFSPPPYNLVKLKKSKPWLFFLKNVNVMPAMYCTPAHLVVMPSSVRNMWQGFVGRLKQNLAGDDLDLDGDGVVDSTPYSGDLDGWANYQELPVSMKLKYRRLYEPYISLYFSVAGER